jgi:MFS family permease
MSTDTDLLSPRQQRRNSLVFLLNNALAYLVAPVFYVGVLHAAILESLEASDTLANLPEAVYLWVTPVPVLVAWRWPSPRLLRPMLAGTLLLLGAAGFAVATLFVTAPRSWLIPALVGHAAVIGICNGVRQMCLWELIGRGVSAERRGWTLGWTFGLGPVFAVLGSCAAQLVLSGNFLELIHVPLLEAPWNYVLLFGATGPAMWVAAALVGLVDIPCPLPAAPQSGVANVLAGLRLYFLHSLILAAAVAFLLTYGGTMIMNNLSLYARDAIGEAAEQHAGLQLTLRFGFKSLAGLALGWIVSRLHARASLLATTGLCLAGVVWGMMVPGKWYLFSFGLLGAGELFYVYYMNYIVGCSSPQRIRENTAYTNLITVTIGFLPLVFGAVSDRWGFRSSFGLAAAIFVAALCLVCLRLPCQPVAPDEIGENIG